MHAKKSNREINPSDHPSIHHILFTYVHIYALHASLFKQKKEQKAACTIKPPTNFHSYFSFKLPLLWHDRKIPTTREIINKLLSNNDAPPFIEWRRTLRSFFFQLHQFKKQASSSSLSMSSSTMGWNSKSQN